MLNKILWILIFTFTSNTVCYSRSSAHSEHRQKFDIELIEESVQAEAIKGQYSSPSYKAAAIAAYSIWWVGLFGTSLLLRIHSDEIHPMILSLPAGIGALHGGFKVKNGNLDAAIVDSNLQKKSKSLLLSIIEGKDLINKGPLHQQVNEIFMSIKAKTIEWFPDSKRFDWEFVIVKDDSNINAFCLPGGKIAIYTGIIEKAENEPALAAIIGHEVGHAVSMHTAKTQVDRHISSSFIDILSFLASSFLGPFADIIIGGGGELLYKLPFSRSNELEADKIGLVLMSKAGYDPHEAIEFWQRMALKNEYSSLLSTHPNSLDRSIVMKSLLDDVLKIYNKVQKKIDKSIKLKYSKAEANNKNGILKNKVSTEIRY
ncbi:MAG: M48 family metallopeptidase [Oligoflexales bacterium]